MSYSLFSISAELLKKKLLALLDTLKIVGITLQTKGNLEQAIIANMVLQEHMPVYWSSLKCYSTWFV